MQSGKAEYVGERGGSFNFRFPRLRRGVIAVLVIAVAVLIPYFAFFEYVGPNQYGIKEVQIGLNRGIQAEVYPPGYTVVVPFAQILHKLPRNVQVLELIQASGNYDENTAALESDSVYHDRAAKIQTSDGFFVDVDVSILYRIIDAHKAFLEYGGGTGFLHAGVLPRAEAVLKQSLGELTTEEFYQAPLRAEKSEQARVMLNADLELHGIKVEQVLVRYFKYTDRIQANIEEKKLQDQLVFTNQSQRKAAEAQQELNRVETEGLAQVQVTLEQGKAYQITKEAERDLYKRTRTAHGDLLLELAEAQRTRLRNDAMQVVGSDLYVAMEMAKVLDGLEYIMVPSGGENSINPLDLDTLLTAFGMDPATAAGGAMAVPAAAPNPLVEELMQGAEQALEVGKQVSAEPPPDFLVPPEDDPTLDIDEAPAAEEVQ